MNQHEKLNYVEFCSRDLEATKAFFRGPLTGNSRTTDLITAISAAKDQATDSIVGNFPLRHPGGPPFCSFIATTWKRA